MATVPGGIFDVTSNPTVYDTTISDILKLINYRESFNLDLSQTTIVGSSGNLTVVGGGSHDSIVGGSGSVTIQANGGNDYIIGGSGADSIVGGAGNDFIMGGEGNDIVTGGSRASVASDGNTFVFRANSGKDVIGDFDLTKDVIKLRKIDGIETVKDVLKHASQSGDNVVIKLGGGNKITLLNVSLDDLKKNPGDHFDVG